MTIQPYDTRTLVRVVEALPRPHTFLLDRFFPFMQTFDTELIDFDILTTGQKLAPFVSPMVQGKPMRERGFTTQSFKPAYVKPKTALDPSRPMKRRAGERVGGVLSPGERHAAQRADIMNDHREMIIRRKEWMAAQALTTGKVVVEGEDYPKKEVDFGRHEDLTEALTTTARWAEDGVNPVDDIETWALLVQDKSGAAPTDVVMDTKAWGILRKDENFQKILDTRRQEGGSAQLGPISVGDHRTPARRVAATGDFEFWVIAETYVDNSGVTQKLIPDYGVIMGSPWIEGVQAHGAIQDPKAGFQAVEFFPKNWIEEDPAAEFIMTQSAPLVVPSRPNASFFVTVR